MRALLPWSSIRQLSSKSGFLPRPVSGEPLSINRYKEVVYEQEKLGSPQVILAELKDLEWDIQREMEELEAMI